MLPPDAAPARALPDGKGVSALGFGCSSRWSQPSFPIDAAAAILETAVGQGINHFDTAPSYADGEARLGAFLRRRDPTRLLVSTKVGTEFGTHERSFAPDRMRRSFEQSLERLGLSSVDILYLHGPALGDLNVDVFAFFETLRREGMIRYSGINSFDPAVVTACVDSPIDAVMLQYSVSDRRFDTLIDRLAGRGKIVIAGTILAQGVFDLKTFLPRDRASFWYLLRALRNDPLFPLTGARLRRRIDRTGLDPHEAAVRFAVSNPNVLSCLFGTRNPAHLVANAGHAAHSLPADQVAMLQGRS